MLNFKTRQLTLVHEVKDCSSCPANSHGDVDDYCTELKAFIWMTQKDEGVIFPDCCPLKEK